jgi:hypothetical protein
MRSASPSITSSPTANSIATAGGMDNANRQQQNHANDWKAREHPQLLGDTDFACPDRHRHTDDDGPTGHQGSEEE